MPRGEAGELQNSSTLAAANALAWIASTGAEASEGAAAMATTVDVTLKNLMSIEGAVAAALVDYTSGLTLGGTSASKMLDVSVAAAGNTEVVKAKMRTMEMLGLEDRIEDILITLGRQYHLLRPLHSRDGTGLFLYLALDKERGNLALARHQLTKISENLEV
jgi:hypothetical protein